MDLKLLAIIVTLVLAFIGYFYNYFQKLALDKRKERLELLNKQINDFYGPLYMLSESSSTAVDTLRKRLGGVQIFKNSYAPSEHEMNEWINWVINVLMPINERIENIILSHSYLIRENEAPRCLLKFVSHISIYRAIIAKWRKDDYEEYLSPIEYPNDLYEYAKTSYYNLKREQSILIGSLG